MAPDLSSDFVERRIPVLSSDADAARKQIKPRWKRVVAPTDDEDLAKRSANFTWRINFPPEAKARALEMVNNLKEALADESRRCDWMDEPTKKEALKKLAAFNVKIGYPGQVARLFDR